MTSSLRDVPDFKMVAKKAIVLSYMSALAFQSPLFMILYHRTTLYHQRFKLTYGLLVSTALRISVTFDLPHLQNLLSSLLSIYDATQVISRTRPSHFSRETTKSWEWPGDEAK